MLSSLPLEIVLHLEEQVLIKGVNGDGQEEGGFLSYRVQCRGTYCA